MIWPPRSHSFGYCSPRIICGQSRKYNQNPLIHFLAMLLTDKQTNQTDAVKNIARHNDVIMSTMASQITSLTIVYSVVSWDVSFVAILENRHLELICLEAAKSGVYNDRSLWNLTDAVTVSLPKWLSNCRTIRQRWHRISRLCNCGIFGSNTVKSLVNRYPKI